MKRESACVSPLRTGDEVQDGLSESGITGMNAAGGWVNRPCSFSAGTTRHPLLQPPGRSGDTLPAMALAAGGDPVRRQGRQEGLQTLAPPPRSMKLSSGRGTLINAPALQVHCAVPLPPVSRLFILHSHR